MYKSRILVVEDDPAISNLIRTTLETQEYQYHTAQNGAGALMEVISYKPDVMILDLGLPDMDGVDIIKRVRGFSSIPIIVVSARTEDQDKVDALDAGADDYLTKPFSIEEFLARIRAALRRSQAEKGTVGEESSVYTNGDLKIDYAARCVYVKDVEIHLTPIEYRLLCLLAHNTGKVLTHNLILKEVWGDTLASDVPSLRVFMATLRKKIEKNPSSPQYIQTHIGVGYRMIRQ
ncbi:response regulator [Solibaculum mannosilyticum]|uniref:Stage 0 sporulation protein A homolog n=1 Tax=Solibaculum mannosilyticum TaxID=2780922 RepID=A0A7I8D033_9FIRM|nr:response regulator transcription factor [Solibaculum mannosilyticum]MCO7136482.1 response regulator transcription factor [[Clostridium] leptum]BCI60066.1 DNA-binding response regulator [Solibaculum mannosilyticum]CZT57289.1 KDP operon transcriptional regulatory protein KdpE [Eubacteriaceae bacterium CHKCI005]